VSWLERHRSQITFSLVNFLVFGGILFLMRQPAPGSIEVIRSTLTPAPLRVHVCGAVLRPDVYTLPAGSIVKDAVAAAGGPAENADLSPVNLAQALQDQMRVCIPVVGETLTPGSASTTMPASAPSPGPININTASLDELDSLPGIGPALAQRIIEHRPYKAIQEILNVPGIGEGTYEKLKDKITVR